jgi:hypothetical protein
MQPFLVLAPTILPSRPLTALEDDRTDLCASGFPATD